MSNMFRCLGVALFGVTAVFASGCAAGVDAAPAGEVGQEISRDGALRLQVSSSELRLGTRTLTRAESKDWSLDEGALTNAKTGRAIRFWVDREADTLRFSENGHELAVHFRNYASGERTLSQSDWRSPSTASAQTGGIQPRFLPLLIGAAVIVGVLLFPSVANPPTPPVDPDLVGGANALNHEVMKIELAVDEP